jgi:uncharacterized protein (TIGR02217 family)
VVRTAGGHEKRNARWAEPLARYNIGHAVKTPAEMDTLMAFFRARQGRLRGYRYKDWNDFSATGQLIGAGNGVLTQFQLVKNYTSGAITRARTIKKPVAGTVKLYLNGVPQASGWSVDATTGMVTFTAAPGNGVAVAADFEFDLAVRFDTDLAQISWDSVNTRSWSNIVLVEIRI